MISLFVVIIISSTLTNGILLQAMASGNSTNTGNGTISNTLDNTSTAVTSNQNTISAGGQVTLVVTVTDSSSGSVSPAGSVLWNDGNSGGMFSSAFCNLSSDTCTVSYTSASNAPSTITITASYGGDATHQASTGTVSLSILTMHPTSIVITPNSASFVSGKAITFTATVSDASGSPTPPSGIASWSDGNTGGTFSSSSCTLSSGTCTTTYTPSSNAPNSITITASYGGDNTHQTSSGTSQLSQSTQDASSVLVTSSSNTISSGEQVTITSTVTDTTNSQNIPTGTITWSDGNMGGTFSSSSCNLSSGVCNVTYTASPSIQNSITITASYSGDNIHTTNTGTLVLTANLLFPTSITVSPNPATVSPGGSVTFTATVKDTSSSPTTPTSSVSWSDGNGGGTFDQSSCTLSSGSCTVSYTPSANPPNAVTISASYNGDNTHQTSTGSSQLSTNVLHPTTASITPNPATFSVGTPITFTVTISDTTESSSSMIGIVKWTDNGAGGSFSPDACIISDNHCSLEYTPPANPSGGITITASYAGDSTHSESSATASLSISTISSSPSTSQSNSAPSPPTTQLPSTTQPAPTTQSNTAPPQPTTQSSTPTTSSNTQPPTQPSTPSQTSTLPPTTTQSTVHTQPITQSNSKNPAPTGTTSDVNHQPHTNPLATISQAISKAVSELELLFQKL